MLSSEASLTETFASGQLDISHDAELLDATLTHNSGVATGAVNQQVRKVASEAGSTVATVIATALIEALRKVRIIGEPSWV
jgi:hypothetical protein